MVRRDFADDDVEDDDSSVELEEQPLEDSDDGEVLLVESGEESDEAPDDVALGASRDAAILHLQGALHQIQQEKNRTREKRRHQHETNTEQKLRKTGMNDKRLGEDFLASLTPSSAKKSKKTEKGKKLAEQTKSQEDADDEEKTLSDKELSTMSADSQRHENAGIRVIYSGDIKQPASIRDRAEEFRRKQLYGRNVSRYSTKSVTSMKEKRKARNRRH